MTQKSTVARNTTPAVPMTAEQRATFDRDGYLIIRGGLRPDEATDARDAIDRVYASMAKAGSLGPDGSMHLLSAVANYPEAVGLTNHPATFPYVWSTLGWNIHVYQVRVGHLRAAPFGTAAAYPLLVHRPERRLAVPGGEGRGGTGWDLGVLQRARRHDSRRGSAAWGCCGRSRDAHPLHLPGRRRAGDALHQLGALGPDRGPPDHVSRGRCRSRPLSDAI